MTTFAQAFSAHYTLEMAPCAATARLKAIPGNASGPMGLTPDHVKATPEWQAAYRELQAATKASQIRNTAFNRRWKEELRAWRRGGGRYTDRATWPQD